MNETELRSRINALIERCRPLRVPMEQLDDMASLCAAGEWGIALENLCDQLVEYEVVVPPELIAEIETLGRAMDFDERYWKDL